MAPTTHAPDETLAALLLRRLSSVAVAPSAPGLRDDAWLSARGVAALEAELADRGHVLAPPLARALAALSPADLAVQGSLLLHEVDRLLGNDRPHIPLFRGFPEDVPEHAHSLYATRIHALLARQPFQPCVRCGRVGDIVELPSCAHLLCSRCVADLEYCECCGMRLGLPTAAPTSREEPPADTPPVRVLHLLDGTQDAALTALLRILTGRAVPPTPADRADLDTLLRLADPAVVAAALPAEIPVRETRARVLAALLPDAASDDLLARHLRSATDVLRLLVAWSGGEPDLVAPPRLRSLPRRLRRTLLRLLDGFDPHRLVEDLRRHPGLWKRAGELLHPFEHSARHPRAALAFAVLRGTDPFAPGLTLAGDVLPADELRLVGGESTARLTFHGWGAQVERALATGDLLWALELLRRRPGELVRRLHQLLRWGAPEVVEPVLADVLPSVGVSALLAAWGRLRALSHPLDSTRVVFPRGRLAAAHRLDDWGVPVSPAQAHGCCRLLEAELLRRWATADWEAAVLDAGLADLGVPLATRQTSRALVELPRGSRQPLPDAMRLRLFLHWVQPPKVRVDLDLSVALYDAHWRFVGLCDYTHLVHGEKAAVHSGDFTAAPAPHGATEFVDLDLAALRDGGVRFALPVLFSFNDVPFDDLPVALAGVLGTEGPRAAFDPRLVRQRFELSGDSRVSLPLVLDLEERELLWTDVQLPAAGGAHNVWRYRDRLGRLGRDLFLHFAPGRQLSLWETASRRAAAGAGTVLVRQRDGSVDLFRRGGDESSADFAERLAFPAVADGQRLTESDIAQLLRGKRVLAVLATGDLSPALLAESSGALFRGLPGRVDAVPVARVARLSASDLLPSEATDE
ncbi:MXAN_6230/SCO0854 family RING domain-containing protein [Streptacidiphilus monticola]|uniref:MXAN_6230/SCO0854 family RING domain-containing protein n=1 Tax=Streptacidiphilus monticola TaxID=2161674 RepID=A0ABW1GAW7_9ACTN